MEIILQKKKKKNTCIRNSDVCSSDLLFEAWIMLTSTEVFITKMKSKDHFILTALGH